ncbi:type IV secretory system conjugative DNA transfer family protein [Salmonella enterica]|nr:type IV secretory system conjugative DNA transfer family protein [Salmonella enterica]EIL7260311.1 type IV secretory system conjugative DNA transfer family protein [Salmonella enterica]EIX6680825.1 type IV secretory system conjugative DNA transfer family protein [Salmonella enterica]EJK0573540.1 type IV secretory system conjugative DNA transfer family protein [Salmonella enterica]EJL2619342.1 type IV secretory system conjugative DNA transfer family protein [Salmonella enterica]
MKRFLLACALAFAAASAHAQGTDSQKCQDPQNEFIRQTTEKSCAQIEAEAAISAQDKANMDLVNGAQRLIQSGNRADVLAGLDTLQGYLARAESTLGGKGLEACTSPGGSLQWNRPPCDPMPLIKRSIDREFQRLGWPVAASPSAAYAWLISQYRDGAPDLQRQVRDFASSNVFDLLPHAILARVEALNRAQLVARAAQERREAREAKQAHDAGLIGNFTSIGDRLKEALWNAGGGLLAVFLFPMVFAIPLIGPLLRAVLPLEKAVRGLFLLWFTSLPFWAAYVLFGGWLSALGRLVPASLNFPLILALYVPACVLVQRSRWYAALYARMPARLRGLTAAPRASAAAAAAPVAAAGGLHGSAHWTTTEQAVQLGRYQPAGHVLADSHGFALGRPLDPDNKAMRGRDARFRYMGHVLTIAPNGSGKGIGAVIPTLLDYPGSTVVLDVKGENYAATARFRREQLGHAVYLVDPFGVTGQPSHRFNWLDRLDPDSPAVVEEAGALADLMIVPEGHASDASAHFNETAKIFLRGLLVHVATLEPERRNMGEVRRLLTLGDGETKELLEDMMVNKRGFDLPPRAARAFLNTPDKERGGLRSTLNRHLAFLDDPRLLASLSSTDFLLDDLKRRPMTVYLVMPPHSLHAYRGYVRGFFGQALMSILATGLQKSGDLRVLFLLDEFAQLGHMNIVAEKLSVIRGYGAAMWFIMQNLGQLKETYPRWQDFFANCNAKQWFGTSDVDTAEYISKSLGKLTVEYQTANSSSGSSIGTGVSSNSGAGSSQQFTGRDLMTADEIMRLPTDVAIVQVQGEAPHRLRRLNYLTDPEYAGLFDPTV